MGDLGSFVDKEFNCKVANSKLKSPVSGDLGGILQTLALFFF
jgi:hypothetical protein